MPTTIQRDGITIIINPLPMGKVPFPQNHGILKCERCEVTGDTAVRNEGGWELWYVLQRYTDLCPSCVPKVERICEGSRRRENPEYATAEEYEAEQKRRKEGFPF